MRFLRSAACCAFVVATLHALGAEDARVPKSLRAELEKHGQVRAVVVLASPAVSAPDDVGRLAAYAAVQARVLAALPVGSCVERYRYRYSPVLVLEVRDPLALKTLASSPDVEGIHADHEGSGALLESRAMVRADTVHEELGILGEGRIVAVLDTGVDTDHPDLAGAIVHEYRFLGGGASVGVGAEDGNGHGTNVTGIIASRGTQAPLGIAPAADVIAVKVLDDNNRGFLSDWAAGMEHVIDLVESGEFPVVDAINMSLVSDAKYASQCDNSFLAFANACRRAMELGISIFASSGNDGSTTEIGSPSCFSAVFAVGSVRDSLPDTVSSFTSRNADVVILAPGQVITSTGVGGGTSIYQGTSQASPHCAALACLLRQVSPALGPAEVLALAQDTGVPVFDTGTGNTYARIDVLAAVSLVSVSPGDCNTNGVADFLDVSGGTSADCNDSLVPDECEIASGSSLDCDLNGVPDECEPDCDLDGIPDDCEIAGGTGSDCNANGIPDECEIAGALAHDCNLNGIPDDCEPDCDLDGTPDDCEIAGGTAIDDDGDGIPDECAGALFHRGDPNSDGSIDLSDAVFIFAFLFLGADGPSCTESADANNDFSIDLSDGISILAHLFFGSLAPAPPGPPGFPCGADTEAVGTSGNLGCATYESC